MDQADVPYFKVFGLQRSGTNLMRALITENFVAEYLEEHDTGWKHGPLRLAGGMWKGKPVRFVLCVKNPYAWALSCYRFFRRSHGGDPTMAPEFYRDPSMSFEEFLLTPNYGFETPIHRWNQMNRLWLSMLPAERTIVVRQEDQLHSQTPALENAERVFRLPRRREHLSPIEQRVDVDVSLRGAMNSDYFLHRQFMEEYSPTLLNHVNAIIDLPLMEEFDYRQEPWALEYRHVGPLKLYVRPCTSDAATAFEASSDPHRLEQIKRRGEAVTTAVVVGAGIGASSMFLRGLWPQASVVAFETSTELTRLLCLNTRAVGGVTARDLGSRDNAAFARSSLSGLPSKAVQIPTGDQKPSKAGIEEFLGELQTVSILQIDDLSLAEPILRIAVNGGAARRIRWLLARLSSKWTDPETLRQLAATHAVEMRHTPHGVFICAERLNSA